MLRQRNSRKQGDVGLGAAIAHFSREGFTVCIPLTDSQDYDLVVDDGERLQRVQVRTSRYRLSSGSYQVNLRVLGGNQSWNGVAKSFDPNRFELLFVLVDSGDEYLIPTDAIRSHQCVVVGPRWEQFRVGKAPSATDGFRAVSGNGL